MLATMNPIAHGKGTVWVWGKCDHCKQEKAVEVRRTERICEKCGAKNGDSNKTT